MVVSMKFSRIPRSHARLDFRQFWQMGVPSSHLRCRDLQVKHPVRTRFGFAAAAAAAAAVVAAASALSPALLSDPFMEVGLPPTVLELLGDFFAEVFRDPSFDLCLPTLPSAAPGVSKPVSRACCDCSAVICKAGSPCKANLMSSNGVGKPYAV